MTTAEPGLTGMAARGTVVDVAGEATVLRRAGSGEAVLFLHGAFFPRAWLPWHDRMSERVDLIAPLHPGYAEGIPPVWVRGFLDLVLHYHDLLDALSLPRIHLVGYDLGAWLAAEIATYYPERVRSLAVVAPYGLRVAGQPALEYLGMAPGRVTDALFNGDPVPAAALMPPVGDLDGFVEAYAANSMTARLIWERRYELRLERWLPRLALPSLVLAPGEDRVVPVAHAERWAELLPGSRLEIIDGVGHALLAHDPDRTSRSLVAFIEESSA